MSREFPQVNRKRAQLQNLYDVQNKLNDCMEQNVLAIYAAQKVGLHQLENELRVSNLRLDAQRAGLDARLDFIRRELKEAYEASLKSGQSNQQINGRFPV